MLKEYISRWNSISLMLNINGVNTPVQFKMKRDGGSYFVTTDEDIMNVLESNKRFNVDYTLHRTEKKVEEKSENTIPIDVFQNPVMAAMKGELEEIKVIEDIVNISQAREHLKKMGIDYRKLNTPNAILKQAQENNIEFPNLTIE